MVQLSQEVPLVGGPQPVHQTTSPGLSASRRVPSGSYGYMKAVWKAKGRPKLHCGLRSLLEVNDVSIINKRDTKYSTSLFMPSVILGNTVSCGVQYPMSPEPKPSNLCFTGASRAFTF